MIDLKSLINEYPDCLDSGERLKAYLSDLYPNEFGRINILATLLDYGITDEIQKDHEHNNEAIASYINKFVNDFGYDRIVAEECVSIWVNALTEDFFENLDIIYERLDEYTDAELADYMLEDEESLKEVFLNDLIFHLMMLAKCEHDKLTEDEINLIGCFIGDGNVPSSTIRAWIDELDEVKQSWNVNTPRIINIIKNVEDVDLHKRIKNAFAGAYHLLLNCHGRDEIGMAIYETTVEDLISRKLNLY